MRSVLVWSITGIVLATALLGMSEIAQSASAVSAGPTKSGSAACTNNGLFVCHHPGFIFAEKGKFSGTVAEKGNPNACGGGTFATAGGISVCAP